MDEASEEDRICPYGVPRPIDEDQLSCLEIYPPQRVVPQTTAQDPVTGESVGPEDERPSLPSELAGGFACAATPRGPAEERRDEYRQDDTASSIQLGPPRG